MKSARPLHLAILLHMHQPWYVSPEVRSPGDLYALLPWVRLHGASGYLDVATALSRHREVHLTVNLVPSLILQLEAVGNGSRDRYLDLCERPPASLSPEERVALLCRLFSIHWGRAVLPHARYRELLDKRGREVSVAEIRSRAGSFSQKEIFDLSVLFHLFWLGHTVHTGDQALEALVKKGQGYSEEDLRLVLSRGRSACQKVLPLYKSLFERGQVELTASPMYHPIVPLLCNTASASMAMPEAEIPRFAHPSDAALQIEKGRAVFASHLGKFPAGMWPSEGCLSEEAVAHYAEAGVRFLVSDEGNLFRSRERSGLPAVVRAEALLRPYEHRGVALFFRDRDLSDRIGFHYHDLRAEDAVNDLLKGVARAASGLSGLDGEGETPVLTLALDGENPWAAYEGHGVPFLEALFGALEKRPVVDGFQIRPVTFSEHLEERAERRSPPSPLSKLWAGSWIDSDYHVWIGDPIKNRAWGLLAKARATWERISSQKPDRPGIDLARAREMLLVAEGSDWFWWFGEPFHSNEDALYDGLFRGYLQSAYRFMGEDPPEELLDPVDPNAGHHAIHLQDPQGFISPRIDGRKTSFYEWHGAGTFVVPRGAAMADTPEITAVHFGFDKRHLYVRIDPAEPALLHRDAVALEVLQGQGSPRALPEVRLVYDPSRPGRWHLLQTGEVQREEEGPAAAREVLELAVPRSLLPGDKGQEVLLVVRLLSEGKPRARYPRESAIRVRIPDAAFTKERWLV